MIENLFTTFIEILNQILEIYRFEGKYDDVMLLFDSINPILELSELRKEDKAKFLIQVANIKIGQKFLKDFDYDDEIRMLQEAQKLAEYSNVLNVLADAIDLEGNCIYSKGILNGEFKEALDYYNKALSIRIQINDKLGLSKSYFHLGLYHENKKDPSENDHQKAFEYYEKGMKIAQEENFKLEQSYFFRHLAGIYAYVKEDLDKGLDYFKKSTQLREEIGFIFSLQFAYFAEAFVYFLKKDMDNARDYFIKTYSAAIRVNRLEALKTLILRRGEEIIKEIDIESALEYYSLILDAAKHVDDKDGIREIKLKIEDIERSK